MRAKGGSYVHGCARVDLVTNGAAIPRQKLVIKGVIRQSINDIRKVYEHAILTVQGIVRVSPARRFVSSVS